MSTNVTYVGTSYAIPAVGESNWGTVVSSYLIALATGSLTKGGGAFTLTAEADFGATYGLKSAYFKSRGTVAAAGVLRLGNTELVAWRNAANSGDLGLTLSASDWLQFNGVNLADISSSQTLTNKTIDAASNTLSNISNSSIASGAAIAYSKLSLTGSIVNADIANSAAIAYSKLNLSGSVVNADIASNAAIGYSKLDLAGSIVDADLSNSAAIAYSKLALTGAIVNADISSSAAIAKSKLALTGSLVTGDLAAGFTLPIANGGSGQTSANAALNALLPSQTSNSGKVLSTDGSNTSWASAASSILNQYNTDIGDSSNTRTSTNTNLLGDAVATTQSATATITIAAPGVVTYTSHGRATYDKVYFTTTGALPTGLSASTTYYITVVDADSFKLSTSLANAIAGTFITTSGSQSGTHTCFAGGFAVADASTTARGLINPTTQTLGGVKTFADGVKVDDAAGQSTLNYYATTTATVNIDSNVGGWNAGSVSFTFTRIGNLVTVIFKGISSGPITKTTSTGTLRVPLAIPTDYLPVNNLEFPVIAVVNGTRTVVSMIVGTNGTFTIYKSTTQTSWAAADTADMSGFSFSYTTT